MTHMDIDNRSPVRFVCGGCGARVSAPAANAGAFAACPRCKRAVVIPEPTPAGPPPDAKTVAYQPEVVVKVAPAPADVGGGHWPDDRRRRRERRRTARRRLLLSISTVIAAAFLAAVAVGMAYDKIRRANAPPPAATPAP